MRSERIAASLEVCGRRHLALFGLLAVFGYHRVSLLLHRVSASGLFVPHLGTSGSMDDSVCPGLCTARRQRPVPFCSCSICSQRLTTAWSERAMCPALPPLLVWILVFVPSIFLPRPSLTRSVLCNSFDCVSQAGGYDFDTLTHCEIVVALVCVSEHICSVRQISMERL